MNNDIFLFFYNLAHQSVFVDGLIVFFAVYFPYAVILIAGVFILMHHEVLKMENPYRFFLQKKKEVSSAFLTGILAWILAFVLKFLFQMPRPFDLFSQVQSLIPESGYAFPSGHATFFASLALSIFFFHKKVGYIFMLFALVIGLARITAGVHFPVDILSGFVLGNLVAYLVRNV